MEQDVTLSLDFLIGSFLYLCLVRESKDHPELPENPEFPHSSIT